MRAVTHPVPAGLLPAVAIDGKLLHGTRTEAGQVFLVAAITHHGGVILGQRQVGDKRGENTVVADRLTFLEGKPVDSVSCPIGRFAGRLKWLWSGAVAGGLFGLPARRRGEASSAAAVAVVAVGHRASLPRTP